jgi:N-acetyl-gamma-glutamyl-phosphate reductase
MNTNGTSVAVLGATGYTGQEMVRLLERHPGLSLRWASSESEAGGRVRGTPLSYQPASAIPLAEADVVFTCLPHGEAEEWSLRAREAGARVVDLSADLRLGKGGAVYGIPELWREAIAGRELVANPGCYPTGILLTLAPLIREGLLADDGVVMIDAASGVTGAGRAAKRDMLFAEVAEDYRAYGVGNAHRHVPEIEAGLARIAGANAPQLVFTPHLLPVRRGILETMVVPVAAGVESRDVVNALRAAYADEPFVDVLESGLPSLRDVVGTNMLAIGCAPIERVRTPLVLCVAAFDNLVKGAAGQALQNANLMLGFDEREGLRG